MGQVIGEVLPLALGVAISPIPIIAAILMLLSPKARGTSVGFLMGWVLGIVVAVVVFALLSSFLPESGSDAPKPISGVIKIVLGIALLALAVRQWRSRPKEGIAPVLPKWMAAIDSMTAGRGFALGFVLAAVNPKNLLMGVAAGVAVGSDAPNAGASVVAVVVYVVIAASTVAVPVIAYLAAAQRMATPLESLRGWLTRNNSTVMAVLLLIIGVVVIGKGLANFS
ncbi:GAP family protein [Herbiconiux ginsengi]|uniref:Threonine/homoserine/homoserine lactone efflux protein n=1 Tax=Herbiconiux ginsengi TaxID=381665 RepID=A0A1H3S8Y0_9MICO|nr:GAP family protein [Herbiconiux ginsengi]SDZ34432.1 Threonine/homoserine/homoserine lactone efflux protein [Herbiconiux ginsengi]